MRKILALLLATSCVLSLVACGEKKNTVSSSTGMSSAQGSASRVEADGSSGGADISMPDGSQPGLPSGGSKNTDGPQTWADFVVENPTAENDPDAPHPDFEPGDGWNVYVLPGLHDNYYPVVGVENGNPAYDRATAKRMLNTLTTTIRKDDVEAKFETMVHDDDGLSLSMPVMMNRNWGEKFIPLVEKSQSEGGWTGAGARSYVDDTLGIFYAASNFDTATGNKSRTVYCWIYILYGKNTAGGVDYAKVELKTSTVKPTEAELDTWEANLNDIIDEFLAANGKAPLADTVFGTAVVEVDCAAQASN